MPRCTSGSASFNHINSTYKSVTEQTGLYAGNGGYDIYVGKNTSLTGAVIASEADPTKNHFSTDTLTVADLDNKARYESYGASASFQFSSSGGNSAKASETGQGQNTESTQSSSTDASKSTTTYSRNYGVSLPQFGSTKGTTSSAIAEGSLEIRSGENVDVSRDTANANGSIGKIFDKGEVTRNAELSQTVGQVAFTAVGDLASQMQRKSNAEVAAAIQERSKYEEGSEEYAEADQRVTDALKSSDSWADGGKYRVALHAAAGALVASAGGGSLTSGAIVGAGNELLVAELGDLTKDMPDSERRNLLKLASSVAGAAIASATGGSASDIGLGTSIATSATEYNYLSHDEILAMRKRLIACQKNSCSDKELKDIAFEYVVVSARNDVKLKQCIASKDAGCLEQKSKELQTATTDDLLFLAKLDDWTNNSSLTDLQYQDKIAASIAQGDRGTGNWGYLLSGVLYPVRQAAGVQSAVVNYVSDLTTLVKALGDESARASAEQILSKRAMNAILPPLVAKDIVLGYLAQLDEANAAEKRGDKNQADLIRGSVAMDVASLLVPVASSVAGKADSVLNSSKGSVKPVMNGVDGELAEATLERQKLSAERQAAKGEANSVNTTTAADTLGRTGDIGEPFQPSSPVRITDSHSVDTIGPNTRFGGGDRNTPKTIAMGDVDLQSDIDAINNGQGRILDDGQILAPSGRTYGSHPGSPTIYPTSGPGLVNLTQAEFQIYRNMLSSGGLQGNALRAFEAQMAAGNRGLSSTSAQRLIQLYKSKEN